MKRTLLLSTVLLSSAVSLAQTNLALGGTATATSASENAGLAIDGDENTRWEAPVGDFADSEDVTWSLDFGSVQTFNTIQIKWEGDYSKSFVISVSEDGNEYTDVVVKTDEMVADLLQNYTFGEVNARYIRFRNVERATPWGVSFWEFRVFKMDAAVLSAITLSAPETVVGVGVPVTLNVAGKDQIGQPMDAGEVIYEVTPADAGTFHGNVYTSAKAGEATIVAKAGDLTSNEIKITSYAGEKIDIFANMATMVTPIGEGTTTGSMVGAFDDNMASLWDMHPATGAGDEERTYETGFVVDLQALYDITAISATFEGACPEDYTIAFAGNDGVYGDEHAVTGHAGMATFTDFFMSEAKQVRYVRFVSTKAATAYGVKLFDFSIFAENKQDFPDAAAPTEFTATIGAATFSSIALNFKATDDVSTNIAYVISYSDGETTAEAVTSGESGKEVAYTLRGLKYGTAYSISVVAKDGKGNATDPIVLEARTNDMPGSAPAGGATAENVKAVYSDKFGNAAGFVFPDWGEQTVTVEITLAEGDKAMLLSNMNYRGLEFDVMDVTDMETLHVDVFPETANTVTIVPIWRDTENNVNFAEIPYIAELKAGEWNALDIPVSAFHSDDRNGSNNVYQIKLDNGQGNTFIFDNIYFEKTVMADTEAPVWMMAEVGDVADTKATIKVQASDNNENCMLTYTVTGNADGTVVATKMVKAGDEAVIELTALTPETAYTFVVTVEDAAGNKADETRTVQLTTTEKIVQPTSGEGTITVQNDVITEPQTLKYTWRFIQENTKVTLVVEYLEESGVPGIVPGVIDAWTNGGNHVSENCDTFVSTFVWENVHLGDVLEGSVWWALAGGRAETPKFCYTVEDLNVSGIDNVPAVGTDTTGAVYDLSGRRIIKPAKGIYIINGKKVVAGNNK